jgi:hypothetical protein
MSKVLASVASGMLLATVLATNAEAMSRAISTDASTPQTKLFVPSNSVAHLVFISAAGTGQTYSGGGAHSDYLSLNAGTSSSPIPGSAIFCSDGLSVCAAATPIGTAVVLAGSPLDLVLTTENDAGSPVTFVLDSFFTDNSVGKPNEIVDTTGPNVGLPEESGQIYIDQVQPSNNFGVPTPPTLAALLSAPGVSNVQYLGWQDNDPPASAFGDVNVDPWTYNNMVVAVYFTPIGSTGGALPEPSTWAMMLLGLFGLGAAVRTAEKGRASVTV